LAADRAELAPRPSKSCRTAKRTRAIVNPLRTRAWLDRLTGAPLDLIKIAAAGLMLGDHVNTVLLGSSVPLLWRMGRIAFPLFCFVLVCHLLRGVDPGRYVVALLVLAIPTQPIFATAFHAEFGSIFVTLAAGAALAAVLAQQSAWVQHAVLAAGVAAVFAWPGARTGVDFGAAGMLLPAALMLTLAASRSHGLWLVAVLLGLNAAAARGAGETWLSGMLTDGLFAGLGALIVILCAARWSASPRFLPRFALQAFYPGHLLALIGLRALGLAG